MTEEATSISLTSFATNLGYLINQVYKPFIVSTVRFRSVIPYMDILRDVSPQVTALTREGRHGEAAELCLEHLKESSDPGKYQSFLDALRATKNSLVVECIEKGEIKEHHNEHVKLLDLLGGTLAGVLNPSLMTEELLVEDVISQEDADAIRKLEERNTQEAAFLLLDTIPRKDQDWYDKFLRILIHLEKIEAVKLIDPEWYNKNYAETTESSDEVVEGSNDTLMKHVSSSSENESRPKINSESGRPGGADVSYSGAGPKLPENHSSKKTRNVSSSPERKKGNTAVSHQLKSASAHGAVSCKCEKAMEDVSAMKGMVHALMEEFRSLKVSHEEDMSHIHKKLDEILKK